jgi:hypothetical protein
MGSRIVLNRKNLHLHMLKLLILLFTVLVSFSALAQDDCVILISDVVTIDEITGFYNPIIKEANCEWKKFELVIYNRWGNEVQALKAINEKWNTSELPSGSYNYRLTATSMTKQKVEQMGVLTLVK